ncbi:outer membrane beta-barrel protein [Flavobacterium litorale]|uniref:PorT family protein n=1 Tax=Flavobacterium litorale TaxID=2856519 RepID=A0ABX8V6D6_9FLAO|nr:outer membrane beta-barrel protein [Flavobacterium litorale]QYJ68399.1 PorT family protein [Flavobacterium litorale]
MKTIMIKVALKTIFITALLLVGTFASNAQSNGNFKLGIKAGGNLTNLKNANAKAKIGLAGGVFTEYRISEKFSVRSEALFSMQGAKGKGSFETVKLNYINVLPGLAKFYPVKSFSIELEPYGGFLATYNKLF